MARPVLIPLVCFVAASLGACDTRSEASADTAAAPTLSTIDFTSRNADIVELPKAIREISGLATSGDGRLFAISDEKATIYELDAERGDIVKRFDLGDPVVRGDFEGLAIAGERFFAITSNGELFTFAEGVDGASVSFERIDVGLDGYDIEGLCHDATRDALLIACKLMPDDRYDGNRGIYEWSIGRGALEPQPRFLVSEKQLDELGGSRLFRPSGIERNATSGTFLVIASQGSAIIEIGGDGRILGRSELPKRVHQQPEGIAIARDGTLIISNEGTGRATLVRYRLIPS